MKPEQEDGGPAFPHSSQPLDRQGNPIMENHSEWGMSLRDYFAAAALQGALASKETLEAAALLISRSDGSVTLEQLMAIRSYAFADAMLAARKEGA